MWWLLTGLEFDDDLDNRTLIAALYGDEVLISDQLNISMLAFDPEIIKHGTLQVE